MIVFQWRDGSSVMSNYAYSNQTYKHHKNSIGKPMEKLSELAFASSLSLLEMWTLKSGSLK